MTRFVTVEMHPNLHGHPEVGVPMPVLHRDLFYLEERVLVVGTIGFHHDIGEFPGNVEILGVLRKSAD